MSARIAARFRVTGVVQGVGFRASTRRQACALGLDGCARNLNDGSVELIAAGTPEQMQRLREWLAHGPPTARVARVASEPVEVQHVQPGFLVS